MKTAQNSTLAKIRDMIYDSKAKQASTQQFIETFSSYYTPTIIFLALGIMLIPPLFFHAEFIPWFLSALTLLVIACPCALVISTPISIYSAIGKASSMGALIKGGKHLEALGDLEVLAFDKTRTLTTGRPHVTDVVPLGDMDKKELLSCAAGIASYSEHPVSVGVVNAAKDQKYDPHPITNYQSLTGKGAKADCLVCQDSHHCMGKLKFILEEHNVPQEVFDLVDKLQTEGKTVIIVCTHERVEGVIALEDELKSNSKELITEIISRGIEPIILTGDAPGPTKKIAHTLGISNYKTELLPEDKSKVIDDLVNAKKIVGMVGDGVNDAPALARAQAGISMSALGSDTAIDAASIVLLGDNISLIPKLIDLGRRTVKIIKMNTAGAIAIKLIFVSLALVGMGNLVMAIFADVGVTVLVVLNSLRLMK
jgi:Cd2+/Zn2+-exporting ATPase